MTNVFLHEALHLVRAPGTHTRYLDELGEIVRREGNAKGSAGGRSIAAWATVFLTGHWPQIVTFWQMPGGWEGFAEHFDSHPELFHQPLERWYGERSGGFDKVLVGADFSPTLDEIVTCELRAPVVLQQTIGVRPGSAREYLGCAGELQASFEGRLLGGYSVAFRNESEVILLWGYPSFAALVEDQQTPDSALRDWAKLSSEFETARTAVVLRPTSWSALR
jgi:hypothetical protein